MSFVEIWSAPLRRAEHAELLRQAVFEATSRTGACCAHCWSRTRSLRRRTERSGARPDRRRISMARCRARAAQLIHAAADSRSGFRLVPNAAAFSRARREGRWSQNDSAGRVIHRAGVSRRLVTRLTPFPGERIIRSTKWALATRICGCAGRRSFSTSADFLRIVLVARRDALPLIMRTI